MCAERLTIVDILTHVLTVGIDGLLHSRLLDSDVEGILANARDAGTGTTAIVRTIVVMTDRDDDPVALLDALAHIRPKTIIEGTAAHATEGLVLYGYLVLIEELMLIVSPTPLTIVAIAEGTIAHGRVAYQEKHRVVALAARSWGDTCSHRLVETIHSVVYHMVDILHRTSHLFCLIVRLCESCCRSSHQSYSK